MNNVFKKFTWKIGGEAGFGIKSAGLSFAKALMRSGYETFDYVEYPSLIRGSHNTYQVTVSDKPVHSTENRIDILVALNKETIDKHLNELTPGAAVIYDGGEIKLSPIKYREKNIHLISVPFKKITEQTGGGEIMRNTVAMGATIALIDLPLSVLENIIKELFSRKPDVIASNLKAIELGYKFVKENYKALNFKIKLEVLKKDQRLLISGNEAMGMGALAGGLNFFTAYPMTPSTTVMQYLAAHGVETGLIVKHAEDEISVINMALGAAHVGARAMCATSGGGFALMGEAVGLACVSETPLVIINVQRPGPATGMPTWTDQGDLRFVLHSAQGEGERIVLAPGDINECFYQTAEALNIAEKYQLPVIVLSDKFLGEGTGTVERFDENKVTINRGKLLAENKIPNNYKRYKLATDGVSARTLPGMKNGLFLADSYEHDEYGYSSEKVKDRLEQVHKRAQKLVTAAAELNGANLYGPANAKITLVAWGSVKGPVLDALDLLPEKIKNNFNLLHLNVIWPFPAKQVGAILGKAGLLAKQKKIVLVENNYLGQLGLLIRQDTGIEIKDRILRYDGRPFFPEELVEEFKKIK
ncbi:MAG: Pyruvate flavodoxin/ferredoxin oxidoreductase-like protein [Candidatus Falkowbacteria bacterium GW2011_GWF2_39_8]|uniref:Pyruvate flavodoxin/ferredoxin oxidoreductase-like protein n=1 Tax=Candidatus Falkowbacteria bacterium GW2011_GWF2_39_8 TaxID=1618642 RepID=A0A0G0T0I8_9BACT|nr:MAG: Pyruvate flavodoxin/ferredoxin oxidoreductase-like protein [Candidatus Falkowbacteria bacterium GW2011_GWF2_39_8]